MIREEGLPSGDNTGASSLRWGDDSVRTLVTDNVERAGMDAEAEGGNREEAMESQRARDEREADARLDLASGASG